MEEEEKGGEKKEPLDCVCNSTLSELRLLDSKEVSLESLVTTSLKPAMAISTYLLIITLNVNGLNAPIKRHRAIEWIKKQDPSICHLKETHLKPKDIHRLKVKGWRKIFHENNREKKAGVTVLVSDKVDFKTKKATRAKEDIT